MKDTWWIREQDSERLFLICEGIGGEEEEEQRVGRINNGWLAGKHYWLWESVT